VISSKWIGAIFGLGQKPPVYLKAGQVIRLGIEGLGEQRQKTVQA